MSGLPVPNPDFVEGPEMEEFLPFPVDEPVNVAVLYEHHPSSMALPYLTGEFKGRGKDMEEVVLKSAYNGGALVHARNQAFFFPRKSNTPHPPGLMAGVPRIPCTIMDRPAVIGVEGYFSVFGPDYARISSSRSEASVTLS